MIDDLRSRIGYKTHDDEHIAIPLHIAEQCKACGVDCASGDNVSLGSVKATIKSLEAKKDAINSNIQRMMVEIQDSMGKYSVYTDGAESQIRKLTDSLIKQTY